MIFASSCRTYGGQHDAPAETVVVERVVAGHRRRAVQQRVVEVERELVVSQPQLQRQTPSTETSCIISEHRSWTPKRNLLSLRTQHAQPGRSMYGTLSVRLSVAASSPGADGGPVCNHMGHNFDS